MSTNSSNHSTHYYTSNNHLTSHTYNSEREQPLESKGKQKDKIQEAEICPHREVESKDAKYKLKNKSIQQVDSQLSDIHSLKKIKTIQDLKLIKLNSYSSTTNTTDTTTTTTTTTTNSSTNSSLNTSKSTTDNPIDPSNIDNTIQEAHLKEFEVEFEDNIKSKKLYLKNIQTFLNTIKPEVDKMVNEVLENEFHLRDGERHIDDKIEKMSIEPEALLEYKKIILKWELTKDAFEDDAAIIDIQEKINVVEGAIKWLGQSLHFLTHKEYHQEIISQLKEIDNTSNLINTLIDDIKQDNKEKRITKKLTIVKEKIENIEDEKEKTHNTNVDTINLKHKFQARKSNYNEVKRIADELAELSSSNDKSKTSKTKVKELQNKANQMLLKYNKNNQNPYNDLDSLYRDLGKKLTMSKLELTTHEKEVKDLNNTLLANKIDQQIRHELKSGPAKSKTIQKLYELETQKLKQMKNLFDEINIHRYGKTYDTTIPMANSFNGLEIVAERKIPMQAIDNIMNALTH